MSYTAPDFSKYTHCRACTFVPAPQDRILPDGFLSTTNYPTYVKIEEGWFLAKKPRMDGHIVWDPQLQQLEVKEFRAIRKHDLVAVAEKEDGTEGVLVWDCGWMQEQEQDGFSFMSSDISREKPVDYEAIFNAFRKHKDMGHIVWVIGPALVHARGRVAMEWMIEQGYCDSLLTGNAVAVHDIESALFGSTLGMKSDGTGAAGGHSCHMRAINEIKKSGSVSEAVFSNNIESGIMSALVRNKVPYVLAGSIRDDGPLPDTITDAVLAQAAMREYTSKATMVVMVATALHSIAVGNMLPTYYLNNDDVPEELVTICVDQTEFLVSKLKDRGTHQAFGVVTNAQDFMRLLQLELSK